eukprot:scaffold36660_cov33-Tisochrysis_lutea.AAC.1
MTGDHLLGRWWVEAAGRLRQPEAFGHPRTSSMGKLVGGGCQTVAATSGIRRRTARRNSGRSNRDNAHVSGRGLQQVD